MTAATPNLHRLIYRSRQTPDTAADLDFSVRQIIQSAIRRNRTVGVTGLLLTIQGHFVQVLEGSPAAVASVYDRISADTRHIEPVLISSEPVAARLFKDWNMCARALALSDVAILDVLDQRGAFDPVLLTPRAGLKLLTTVAAIQRRTAGLALAS